VILLNSGYSKAKAFALNMLSSCATLAGGVLGYYSLQVIEGWTPVLLGIVGASMIYVAVADLIPGLHRRPELRATLSQSLLIGLGIASIALVRVLLGDLH
jgi:zinc and cadmium transporter